MEAMNNTNKMNTITRTLGVLALAAATLGLNGCAAFKSKD